MRPKLSFVVIAYRMSAQLGKTLHSLSSGYQRNVSEDDFEVVVIENRSDETLDAASIKALPKNVRYELREQSMPSPVEAINYGVSCTRGEHVAIVIDGARMMSPGVVRHCLDLANTDYGVITVPGYHLGAELQQESVGSGYDQAAETELLAKVAWPFDGYKLFEVSCFSGSCRAGFFMPMSESNCLVMPRTQFDAIGGYNMGFNSHGGGFANLDIYKRAIAGAGNKATVLFSEGTFHQFHGGVTTGGAPKAEREETMAFLREQYATLVGEPFSPPTYSAVYHGEMHASLSEHFTYSTQRWQRSVAK